MLELILISLLIVVPTSVACYFGYRTIKEAPLVTSKGIYAVSDATEIIKLRASVLEVLKSTMPGTNVTVTVETSGEIKERMTFKLEAIKPG